MDINAVCSTCKYGNVQEEECTNDTIKDTTERFNYEYRYWEERDMIAERIERRSW